MGEIDERKLRLYRYMLRVGKITIDEVPEPYKTALQGD